MSCAARYGTDWPREYYFERVFVDIAVKRMVAWPDLSAAGEDEGNRRPPGPGPAAPQPPPENGTGPRVDVDRAARQVATLPHRVLAYRGNRRIPGGGARGARRARWDRPAAGHCSAGLLPPGGRRAGMLAHSYRPQLVGLSTRIFTGWLEVADKRHGGLRAAHVQGLVAPPSQETAAAALTGCSRSTGCGRPTAGEPPSGCSGWPPKGQPQGPDPQPPTAAG